MKPSASPNLWRPLRVTVFRNLLVADVISHAGAFMQNVGAAWLMVSLGTGPIYVALMQTAASLPYFLLAIPAGSAGDILDRRKRAFDSQFTRFLVKSGEGGEFCELDIPNKIVMTRRFGANPLLGERETTLTYRFQPSPYGALVTVREESFIGRPEAAYGNAENWEKALGRLDGYLGSK
jgi:Transmembrane secretion effector/Activator of Hsp90 ATPase homolog 1-like protein